MLKLNFNFNVLYWNSPKCWPQGSPGGWISQKSIGKGLQLIKCKCKTHPINLNHLKWIFGEIPLHLDTRKESIAWRAPELWNFLFLKKVRTNVSKMNVLRTNVSRTVVRTPCPNLLFSILSCPPLPYPLLPLIKSCSSPPPAQIRNNFDRQCGGVHSLYFEYTPAPWRASFPINYIRTNTHVVIKLH